MCRHGILIQFTCLTYVTYINAFTDSHSSTVLFTWDQILPILQREIRTLLCGVGIPNGSRRHSYVQMMSTIPFYTFSNNFQYYCLHVHIISTIVLDTSYSEQFMIIYTSRAQTNNLKSDLPW